MPNQSQYLHETEHMVAHTGSWIDPRVGYGLHGNAKQVISELEIDDTHDHSSKPVHGSINTSKLQKVPGHQDGVTHCASNQHVHCAKQKATSVEPYQSVDRSAYQVISRASTHGLRHYHHLHSGDAATIARGKTPTQRAQIETRDQPWNGMASFKPIHESRINQGGQ